MHDNIAQMPRGPKWMSSFGDHKTKARSVLIQRPIGVCAHRCLGKTEGQCHGDITEEASAEMAASIHFGDEIGHPPPSHLGRQLLAGFSKRHSLKHGVMLVAICSFISQAQVISLLRIRFSEERGAGRCQEHEVRQENPRAALQVLWSLNCLKGRVGGWRGGNTLPCNCHPR